MSNFEFSVTDQVREAEIDRALDRGLTRERLFVLLLGPSATGKSTIINEMNSQVGDYDFEYVKPMITRPNRPGEVDKISISDEEFDELDASGEFIVVNSLYGVRYGTPLAGVMKPLSMGNVPILDYPLETVDALSRPDYDTLKFYVYPRSIEEWRTRMERVGRDIDGRYESGVRELGFLATSHMTHPDIDISVVNADGAATDAARTILSIINQVVE